MSRLTSALTRLISVKNDLCSLCFSRVGSDAVNIKDQVVLNSNLTESTVDMSCILSSVLGAQFSETSVFDIDFHICNECSKSAISSYKFINMCKYNLEHLANAIDTLNDCLENTTDDLNHFKTLYITIDTAVCTSQQNYDSQSVNTHMAAFARYKSFCEQGKQINNIVGKQTKRKKRKMYDFSKDTFEICYVVRDTSTPTKFKCKVCLKIFSKMYNFKKHYYSQHAPKILKCSECPRSYGSEALLKQHKYDCHSSLTCSECGKTYTNRYSLLYHMRRHTGEHPYECKFCGLKFQLSSRRAEHIRRAHLEPGVECEICHIKFKALGSLYDHRRRHFNPRSRLHVNQKVVEEV